MIKSLRRAFSRNKLLTIGFVVSTGLATVLTLRLFLGLIYWSQHSDLPPEPWMRLGYIAKSNQVSVETLRASIGLDPEKRERRALAEIATDTGLPIEELIQTLKTQIAAAKKSDGKNQVLEK